MTVHCFRSAPPANLQSALSQFEDQFDYPLGENDRFRIDHSQDYTRFFRAMGEAAIFVYEDQGRVKGVLSCSRRRIHGPKQQSTEAIYLCDLKVQDSPSKGRILLRLLKAVYKEFGDQLSHGYAVVMDGTAVVPSQYTGRLGLPAFEKIAEVGVYNITVPPTSSEIEMVDEKTALQTDSSLSEVQDCFQLFCRGGFHSLDSDSKLRSMIPATPLLLKDKSACAFLEDTELAKRLLSLKHGSMCSGHLTQFAYRTAESGAILAREAVKKCQELKRPRLFFSMPKDMGAALVAKLSEFEIVEASATVFAHGFEKLIPWYVNTAEI